MNIGAKAAFLPIFLRQKSFNLKFKCKKDASKYFVQKSCLKNVGKIDSFFPKKLRKSNVNIHCKKDSIYQAPVSKVREGC